MKGVADTSGTKKASKSSKSDDQGTVTNRDWFCPVKNFHENNKMPTVLVGFYHSLNDNRVLPIEMTAVTNLDVSVGEKFTWTIQKRSKVSLLAILKSKNRIVEINHDFNENEENQKFQIPTIDEIENCLCAYLNIKTVSGKKHIWHALDTICMYAFIRSM